jgi:hypothetical protein
MNLEYVQRVHELWYVNTNAVTIPQKPLNCFTDEPVSFLSCIIDLGHLEEAETTDIRLLFAE